MRTFLAFILLALPAAQKRAAACADEPAPIIGSDYGPDADDIFFGANPSIVLPSFEPVYLVGAYKMFSPAGLAPEEAGALENYNRSDQEWTKNYSYGISDDWDSAKFRLLPREPQHGYAETPDYARYINCSAETFSNAAALLEQRVKAYGAASPKLKDWVEAQETVFKNCLHTEGGEVFLPGPSKFEDAALKNDRAYQTAAAYFYAGGYKEARRRFADIGANPRSPYAKLARYLVVRCYVREAFRQEAYSETQEAIFRDAEAAALKVINDPSMAGMYAPAKRLLNLVRYRIAPEKELARLGAFFSGRWNAVDSDWNTAMRDYSGLLGRGLLRDTPSDDMTDWILAFTGRSSRQHAAEKWRRGGGTPWLLAALASRDLYSSKEKGGNTADPLSTELLAAAAKVPESAPAYESITYQRIALLSELGRKNEALQLADGLLKNYLSQNGTMHLLALKKRFAGSLPEYLQLDLASQPRRSDEEWQMDYRNKYVLNFLTPLRVFKDIVEYKAIPSSARRALFFPAWTRALVIGRGDTAFELARAFRAQNIDSALNPALDKYLAARTGGERDFRAAAIVMENSGLSPELGEISPEEFWDGSYGRGGYWSDIAYSTSTRPDIEERAEETARTLGTQERDEAEREFMALAASTAPLVSFGHTVLDYAAGNPAGQDIAKALYAITVNGPRVAGKAADSGEIISRSEELLTSKFKKEFDAIKAAEKEVEERQEKAYRERFEGEGGDEGGGE